ncbi:MAG: arylesterase [Gammaproteobacteria bacterium]
MSLRNFIFLLLCFVCWPVWAGSNTILIVGDSLSAGYGLASGESWTALLQRDLDQRGLDYRVVNASISGDTTSGGLARLPRALKIHDPAIVIIELGGNDGLRAVPVTEIRRNLIQMIELGRDAGAEVLLTQILIPPNYGPVYTGKFEQVFAEAAATADATLTPFILDGVALQPGMMQADGIHPTASAQAGILANIWPSLCRLVVDDPKQQTEVCPMPAQPDIQGS